MPSRFFVTGTDTGVGKTVVSALLCAALDAIYWKPIQTGTREGTDRDTVMRLAGLPRERTLPEAYRFAPPVSPHLAARCAGVHIELRKIKMPRIAPRRKSDRRGRGRRAGSDQRNATDDRPDAPFGAARAAGRADHARHDQSHAAFARRIARCAARRSRRDHGRQAESRKSQGHRALRARGGDRLGSAARADRPQLAATSLPQAFRREGVRA